ncbi:hypothetical protein ACIQV4_41280, partial [Streptomyces sp. NPDC098926]
MTSRLRHTDGTPFRDLNHNGTMEPYEDPRLPVDDRIERERLQAGDDPAKARRASVLGRPIEHNRSAKTEKANERFPWLGMDLVFRPPPTAHIAWALMGDEERRVLE